MIIGSRPGVSEPLGKNLFTRRGYHHFTRRGHHQVKRTSLNLHWIDFWMLLVVHAHRDNVPLRILCLFLHKEQEDGEGMEKRNEARMCQGRNEQF